MLKLKDLENNGIYIHRPSKETDYSMGATIVVLGPGRSGTSLIANALEAAGVYMGVHDSPTAEDVKFASAMEKNRQDELEKLISERNRNYQLWGWKRPSTINHIEKFEGRLRAPLYICLFRDVLAISKRNEISIGRSCISSLKSSTRSYLRLINFIESTKVNCILASYEKINRNINILLEALGDEIGKDMTLNQEKLLEVYGKKSEYLERSRLMTSD